MAVDVRPPRHRADIQGLRAVAVLLVVCCHTGLALPGGFVGVDVFFVISGFVIASLLLAELEGTGTLRLGRFFARRARRLLPLLSVVTVATLIGVVLAYNPVREQPIPVSTGLFGSFFAANGYLYRHLGYFGVNADDANPLLHLWSLAVEEQFYLVLAPLLLVAWRSAAGASDGARRRRVAVVVAVASVGSLWLSWAMTTGRSPIALEAPSRFAFYASPTRLWEFGAGVLLALGWRTASRLAARPAAALGVAGAVAVGWSAIAIDPLQPFPGLAAVPVVAGSVALVVAGACSPGVARALSLRPLTWIGDRSYGWYLWHWPLIVFAARRWPGSVPAAVLAALVALGLAAATFTLFEDRVRRDQRLVGWRAAALAMACVLVPASVAVAARAGSTSLGVADPVDWYDQPVGRGLGCVIFNREMREPWNEDACTTGTGGAGTVLVIGDEQAGSMVPAVTGAASARGLDVAEWSRTGCPVLDASPAGYPACASWQRDALALVDRVDARAVVLAAQGTDYDGDLQDRWGGSLRPVLERLAADGVPVVVVGPLPTYHDDFPRPSVVDGGTTPPVRPRAEVEQERAAIVAQELAATEGLAGVTYLDPIDAFCDDTTCRTFGDGRWWYLDAANLTNVGSERLSGPMARALDEAAGR